MLNQLLKKYPEVFEEGLGTFKAIKAKIVVEGNACLTKVTQVEGKYRKATPVPYAIKENIEKELKRLEDEGTIEQLTFSDWAAPIVPKMKENQTVRICGNYKVAVNAVSKLDNYPVPKAEDFLTTWVEERNTPNWI